MRRIKKPKFSVRAISTSVVAIALIAGVTFAALQSRAATITGTSIQTANAGLQISSDGQKYSDTMNGFTFDHLVPGSSTPTHTGSFYLRNTGETKLALQLAVASVPTNPDHVDLSKVRITITNTTNSSDTQVISLQSLLDGSQQGGMSLSSLATLTSGVSQQYVMSAAVDVDAVNGQSATIGNIDLAFTGVAQS
ncbi:MAG TPA: hypothetical protein VF401_01005 [Candidatus Saccharimonadales bacterium]